MDKPRTGREIFEYVDKFHVAQKESVLMEIMKAAELNKFMSTVEGRLITDRIIDSITGDIGKIIDLVRVGGEDAVKNITITALKINVALEFLSGLANIAVLGEKHEKSMG